ncbi:MAG: XdhC family protein [Anaerolineae bacterium]|nr:XdhC family protein [Anaerolineae bacterium]
MSNDNNPHILSELLAAQNAGETVVLATIVKAHGSTPRHAGAKMIIYENGRSSGTIGGGELEARVREIVQNVFQDGQPRTVPYSLVDTQRGDPGVCGGELEVYCERYQPPATVLVMGCGHVGQAVASLAKWMGYRVVVNDDRAELVTPEVIPEADVYVPGGIEDVLNATPITRSTFVVAVTRNVMVDRQILPALARSPAPYIGVMGSRRRWLETVRLLQEDGLTEAEMARFHSPIGLELNAEDPHEIAISIMAEIIMLRRQGTGKRMSN